MKKFLVFLLSLTICLTPSLTFAGAEKWKVLENFYDSSKNVVKVTARNITQTAANSSVYKVNVPVAESLLGASVKRLLVAGVAVGAITALVEGVGWIIDEGSKTIKKPKPGEVPNVPVVYYAVALVNVPEYQNVYASVSDACKANNMGSGSVYVYKSYFYNGSWGYACKGLDKNIDDQNPDAEPSTYNQVKSKQNESYDPNKEPEFVPVSDSELGNEVLGKGTEPNSSPNPNGGIVSEAYNPNSGTPAGDQTADALNSAPPEPETNPTGETKPKPNVDTDGDGKDDAYDPNKPSKGNEFQLPQFCSWATTVCEWYTQYKTDSKNVETHRVKQLSFWEKVQDYMNWSREPPEKDDSDNDVPVKTPEAFDNSVFSKDRFAVSRQCPIPEQHTISLSGVSVNFSFDMTPLCQVLILARPALVACSYLYAAYIVIGAARNG